MMSTELSFVIAVISDNFLSFIRVIRNEGEIVRPFGGTHSLISNS